MSPVHHVHRRPPRGDCPGHERGHFGMGRVGGVERVFGQQPGALTTAAGYAGGHAPDPTYRQVCSDRAGHAEVVLVVYDPAVVGFAALMQLFWEGHDPTQGMRQGNDVGSQYRSVVHCYTPAQHEIALATRRAYGERLREAGLGDITTEIVHPARVFWYAEDEHQQYLSKNPAGYCGLGGTGVSCPVGIGA